MYLCASKLFVRLVLCLCMYNIQYCTTVPVCCIFRNVQIVCVNARAWLHVCLFFSFLITSQAFVFTPSVHAWAVGAYRQVDHEVCSIQRRKHDLHLDQSLTATRTHAHTPAAPYLSAMLLTGIMLLLLIHSCLRVCVFALQTHKMKGIQS